jgi:hypothetical protein
MEPKSPSPYPQVPDPCPYPEPTPSSPHDPYKEGTTKKTNTNSKIRIKTDAVEANYYTYTIFRSKFQFAVCDCSGTENLWM